MNSSFDSVRNFFLQVRELPASERQQWLESNCRDERIRSEVIQLLVFDLDDDFLEQPVVRPASLDSSKADGQLDSVSHSPNNIASNPQSTGSPGILPTIDFDLKSSSQSEGFSERYKLLQKIGEGGFGLVYMAEQLLPVRRRVAIKVLRLNTDSKSVLARFESERQALAMMDHPNIAKVLDGGESSDGRPFFAMELVPGIPITEFCDENQLTTADRMKLLMVVCQAVQHAHHKGVIHRDLKPSNILVSEIDGAPVVKVIDFGIAKAIHGPLTDKTLFTSFHQMIGTPEYMSPEQAETSIIDADTRSDVYSLGVLAYELLTGTTPLDSNLIRKMGFAELQRTICETEPPKPSDRFSTLGDRAELVALKRGVNRSSQQNLLRGDLDWIVMKAMEKDRSRRYGSAQALADDLQRWITQLPIEARPPSFRYKAYKFFRRNQRMTILAVAVTLAGLVATIGLGYGVLERKSSLEKQRIADLRNSQLESQAQIEADRVASLLYGNAMVAANESFRNGRRDTTRKLLAECPASKRGVEWNWLNFLAKDRSTVLMPASELNSQSAIAYDSTGENLFSGGRDGVIRQWSIPLRKETRSWLATQSPITSLSLNDNTKQLLVGTQSGELSVWKIDSATRFFESKVDTPITVLASGSMQSDEDAFQIAVGCDDGSVWFCKAPPNVPPKKLDKLSAMLRGTVNSLHFFDSDQRLLIGGKGGVKLMDLASRELIRSLGQDWMTYSAIGNVSADTCVVYSASVEMLNLSSLQAERSYQLPSVEILAASLQQTDLALLIATSDQSIRRLNLTSGRQQTVAYADVSRLVGLAVAPDGSSLAATASDGSLRLWLRENFSSPTECQAGEESVASLVQASESSTFIMSEQGRIVRWNPRDGSKISMPESHGSQGFSIVVTGDEKYVASNGLDQKLRIWSMETNQCTATFDLALGARYLVSHPSQPWIIGPVPSNIAEVASHKVDVETGRRANLALWNLETGKVDQYYSGLSNWAMKLRFSNDGAMIAAATISDGAVVWNTRSGEATHFDFDGQPQVDDVAFSKDGKYLFVAYHDGQVGIWNIEARRLERKMVCHGDQIVGLLLSADGQRLITASPQDPILRIWDWINGQKVGELGSGLDDITELKFDNQNRNLLIGGGQGKVHLLRLED